MPPDAATWTDRGLGGQLTGTRFADLRWFDRIDSTNRYVLDRAGAGSPEGLVAVADEQTAGRGRLGRRWESPPGASLLVSVLLRPVAGVRSHLTMAVGVALADAVAEVAGFTPRLKWPNDLVVDDRKLAGVLAESDGAAVVVGAGCNVNWGALPPELAETATACDLEAGHPVERGELLVRFLVRLERELRDPEGVPARSRARLDTLGRRVRVERAGSDLVGEAVDLDDDGALVIAADDGRRESVHVGDVVHLRPAPDA